MDSSSESNGKIVEKIYDTTSTKPTEQQYGKPVVLVIGAGAGIGFHVASRFAKGSNYHVCLCRRSNLEGLQRSVQDIVDAGGSASGYLLNAAAYSRSSTDNNSSSSPDKGLSRRSDTNVFTAATSLEQMIDDIENRIGPIHICVYNLGAQIGNVTLEGTNYKQFELGWRLGTFGLFRVAKALLPRMVARHQANGPVSPSTTVAGVLLVTSATAAVRGNAAQHSHTAAMGGRRMLCQSLHAEFAPKGIHVSHLLVDGAVDAPDTLGKMVGQKKFQQLRQSGTLISPVGIADLFWYLAHQKPNSWTFEIDIRSSTDVPWWNTSPLPSRL